MTRLSCPALLLGWFSSCHLFRSSLSYKPQLQGHLPGASPDETLESRQWGGSGSVRGLRQAPAGCRPPRSHSESLQRPCKVSGFVSSTAEVNWDSTVKRVAGGLQQAWRHIRHMEHLPWPYPRPLPTRGQLFQLSRPLHPRALCFLQTILDV